MDHASEQAAITAVLAGDRDAYRPLVERYQAGLIAYAYGIVGDEAAAHDIAQEAFIAAYRRLGQYKPAYAFSTWLYRIARNLAYADLKQHTRWVPYDETLADISTGDDTPEELDTAKRAAELHQALGKLRPEWRSVLQLYYWEDKSYQEIAEVLDAPVNTVRVWLSRAKEQLRSELI